MSFLTPLYLLGLAAVSLPVVFHLIRRMPRGSYAFSSLMFLTPSPPRLTRRSRIDQWLLLLLRAAALILLAAAFARPFLRSMARLGMTDLDGRKVAILVDTSASMQRDGIWPQVVQEVNELLDDLGPSDDVALYRFGTGTETLVAFDDLAALDPARKIAQVRAAMEAAHPGWAASHLGDALVAVADQIDQLGNTANRDNQTVRQIVLISDLQEGARVDALQTYQWPDDVDLVVRTVTPAASTNAGIHLAPAAEDVAADELRIRVSNSRDSERDQFSLDWEDSLGQAVGEPSISVYAPSGEGRVVRVPIPPASTAADRLVLTGDDHPFDNLLFHVPSRQEELQIVYVGDDRDDDTAGPRYYLARAFPNTPRRHVRLVAHTPAEEISPEELKAASMVVLTAAVSDQRTQRLKEYVETGGSMLVVVKDTSPGPLLGRLLGGDLTLAEVEPDDYAMFGQIDFGDALFAPFSDPRFSDFTKVHFWRYRSLALPENWQGRVLARFDGTDPLLLEKPLGTGRIWVLTAGWHPRDSDFSRSTKFVPLLAGMLERSSQRGLVAAQYDVGDSVGLPVLRDSSAAGSVRTPDGATLELTADATSFSETNLPGVYTLVLGDLTQQFAVNVAAQESRTATMSVDELGQRGVAPGQPVTRAEMVRKARQMRDVELEGRQKLWQWLITAALTVLVFETWLAGRLARLPGGSVETGT